MWDRLFGGLHTWLYFFLLRVVMVCGTSIPSPAPGYAGRVKFGGGVTVSRFCLSPLSNVQSPPQVTVETLKQIAAVVI